MYESSGLEGMGSFMNGTRKWSQGLKFESITF